MNRHVRHALYWLIYACGFFAAEIATGWWTVLPSALAGLAIGFLAVADKGSFR